MRVTANMSANNAIYNIQQGRSRLDKLQELISSGQNVNRPSDDPASARLLLDVGDKLKALDQYTSNITKAQTWLKFTSTALEGLNKTLDQAKQQVSAMTSGSTDPSIRQGAHDQLVNLKKQFIDMANTQLGDQYIFAGAKNGAAPFNNTNNNYDGDSNQLAIEIAASTSQNIGITGDRLIKGTGSAPSYGTTDILQTFDDLIAAVGDTTTPSNVAAIAAGNVNLSNGAKQLQVATADLLARTTRLDNMAKLNANNKSTLNTIVGDIQSVDYAKLGVELTQEQTAFQASLSSTAKLTQMSLLDYL